MIFTAATTTACSTSLGHTSARHFLAPISESRMRRSVPMAWSDGLSDTRSNAVIGESVLQQRLHAHTHTYTCFPVALELTRTFGARPSAIAKSWGPPIRYARASVCRLGFRRHARGRRASIVCFFLLFFLPRGRRSLGFQISDAWNGYVYRSLTFPPRVIDLPISLLGSTKHSKYSTQ
jgi:hypothetical protein